MFDARQFKRLLAEDVPADVIKKLQIECGDDLTLAIDRYREMENNKSKISAVHTNGLDKASGTEQSAASDERKAICYRDQYWDKRQRRWMLKRPAKQSSKMGSGKHVLFVRRVYSEKMMYSHTVIVVKGVVIRNALRNIFRGAAGFTLTKDDNVELEEIRFLFWARDELQLLAHHYTSKNDAESSFEIEAGLQFIMSEWGKTLSDIDSMLPYSITFDFLWTIFPPDCLVVGRDLLDSTSVWRVRTHSIARLEDGSLVLKMDAEFVEWNGRKLGIVQQMLQVPAFAGAMPIENLAFIPLRYHPRKDDIIQRLQQRSKKKLKFCQRGFDVQEYEGNGIVEVKGKPRPHYFEGRVIADPKMMDKVRQFESIVPRLTSFRDISRVWISEFTTESDIKELLDTLLEDPNSVEFSNSDNSDSISTFSDSDSDLDDMGELTKSGSRAEQRPIDRNLSVDQQLLLSGTVYGYSLRDARWGAFVTDRLFDVKWNDEVFTQLVMDPKLKDIVFRLVKGHRSDRSNFDDFVRGKGKGLIGLLDGPPGSGKTLTAEAIAETAHMPLYMVSSGALGHEADIIYENLTEILELTAHWKAMLLLDEADVFLARRNETDLQRNAIVSVFLRELEYYKGIMLLTTNQAHIIDDAFQSRIHFYLRYPVLDMPARKKVWQNFIDRARDATGGKVDVSPKGIENLAKLELNGRQIKNATSIAIKLATGDESSMITADGIIATAESLQDFSFKETTKLEETRRPERTWPGVLLSTLLGAVVLYGGFQLIFYVLNSDFWF